MQPTYLTAKFPNNLRYKHLLEEYREVIQMSGHTHISLDENVNFGDENGTAAQRYSHNTTDALKDVVRALYLYGVAAATYAA